MEEILYVKLNDLATIPSCADIGSAGYDLYAATDREINIAPHETVKIGTGLAFEIPFGYFGGIYARSGIATKRGLRPANAVGVIDSSFRGEIIVALHNDTEDTQTVMPKERIAQIVFQHYISVDFIRADKLSDTERGTGGFGSSGR